MTKVKKHKRIPEKVILNKIILLRGNKVMIDSDLAELYGVTTKRLNEQVKRNQQRFPPDFMFQLTKAEKEEIIIRYKHLNKLKFSSVLPFVFTEHGAVMLASVLNSIQAIEVNIQIVKVFVQIRKIVNSELEFRLEIERIKKKIENHDNDIEVVFQCLDELIEDKKKRTRKQIGFSIQ